MKLVQMMYVKFLIVQNNLYIDGLKDMKSQKDENVKVEKPKKVIQKKANKSVKVDALTKS